jgi:hypothetical protein
MTRVRVRNWPAERKARELRKLLNSIDPHPVSEPPPPPPPTPSPAMSLWERPTYKPEQMTSGRSGANNFQHIKSKRF